MVNEEINFYNQYRWALMPFLSLEQIVKKLNLLIKEHLSNLSDWCQREWLINLYMLSSAAADLTDDYLVRGVTDLSKVTDYFSFLNAPVRIIFKTTLIKSRIVGALTDRRLRRWRESWSEWLIDICESLVEEKLPAPDMQQRFRRKLEPLLEFSFPRNLRTMRMRIPAAYRSQDLTHYDFMTLADKYIDAIDDSESQHLVLGLRTAGSYIAPMVCAKLKSKGYKRVNFITIRPKDTLHPWDVKQLKKHCQQSRRFILVDEPPSTGKSIVRSMAILRKFGIANEQMAILVPTHPANRGWFGESLKYLMNGATVIALEPEEWYKEKLLTTENFCKSVTPYFAAMDFDVLEVSEIEATHKINEHLRQNPDNAFHVRLKKAFQVVLKNKKGAQEKLIIMGKSVGWGWLGYHAALAADNLSDFIPRVYGVRNGIMYSEWVGDSLAWEQSRINHRAQILANYITQRANRLRLEENPMPFLSAYREGGLQTMAILLSQVFTGKLSKLKRGWIRKKLETMVCPVPTLLDARMTKDEWIFSATQLLKTDFEHHGFSKTASHNIVDPAYDLAAAGLEFNLTTEEKTALLDEYIQKTGDAAVGERLPFYEILVGNEALSEAVEKLNLSVHGPKHHELNLRYIRSWNYMVSEIMHYFSRFCSDAPVNQWQTPLFVMDIDDVLDKNIFGFPCTTPNGIRALSLLRAHGVCGIINTARSLDEVKDYCNSYGFPGGIAEYGSVFWDAVEQKEHILISDEALEELTRVREAFGRIAGVFSNPDYHYSLRLYFFDHQRTMPLPIAMIAEIFAKLGVKHLRATRSYIDTAILSNEMDKGRALLKLKQMKAIPDGKIGAVGDSQSDLPMLKVADQGFLVHNSTLDLKRSARSAGILLTAASFQSGLLEAVQTFLHGRVSATCAKCKQVLSSLEKRREPFWQIMKLADMSMRQHWLRTFDSRIFEFITESN